MDSLLTALLLFVIDIYIVLFFVRIFTLERERYDSTLGFVFSATDPVLRAVRPYMPWRSGAATALLAMALLVLCKGLVAQSIPFALRSLLDTLLQLGVLIVLIRATVEDYYVNPLLSVAERMVQPVYTVATRLASHPVATHVVTVGILVLHHAVLRLILSEALGASPARAGQEVFIITSLRLVMNLTTFFIYVIIINSLLSWVSPDPHNPIVQLLTLVAAPIVDPVRRVVPPLGGVLDLSPLVAILLLQLGNALGHSLLSELQRLVV